MYKMYTQYVYKMYTQYNFELRFAVFGYSLKFWNVENKQDMNYNSYWWYVKSCIKIYTFYTNTVVIFTYLQLIIKLECLQNFCSKRLKMSFAILQI